MNTNMKYIVLGLLVCSINITRIDKMCYNNESKMKNKKILKITNILVMILNHVKIIPLKESTDITYPCSVICK